MPRLYPIRSRSTMQAVHAVIFLSAMVQAATTADEKKVVLNQVLAEEYAISLLGAVSETLTKDNMRLFNLPGFSIHVAKAGELSVSSSRVPGVNPDVRKQPPFQVGLSQKSMPT